MFRPAQPGDWAADDDEDVSLQAPTPAEAAAALRAQKSESSKPRKQPARATPDRPKRTSDDAQAPAPAPARAPAQAPAPAPVANRWEKFRQQQAAEQAGEQDAPGSRWERGQGGGGRDYGDRDRGRGGYGGRDYGDRDRGGYGGRDRFDRNSRGPPPAPLPTERGVVVSIRDNFGFVSGVEREADLFFHISEAPTDLELQDEVEYRVKYNQRSEKDIAVQLVRLPKGSIVWEDVAEDVAEGVVTKGIPRSGGSFHHSARDEPHGLIEVKDPAAGEKDAEAAKDEGANETDDAAAPTLAKRNKLVRFTADSVAVDAESDKKPHAPAFGDHVRFRIATHRKSGQKRAVDLTITLSAKAQLEKEIEAKLATMTRELGVVARVKGSGGFVRCCDRTEDVYFPFHELRESVDDDKSKGSKLQIREGDEVSFYVYEDKDDERSGRLSALRVVKLPAGTVSFEDVLRSDVEGVVTKIPKEPRNGPEVFGVINPTNPDDIVVEETASDDKGGKKLKKKAPGVSFRLSDAQDVTYIPATGDIVTFDQVLDKRTRRVRASNVRVVKLNPKHRETGVITTIKDEFGFIRCTDRSTDAYFRFSDVMSVANDFRAGTEVAFDLSGGGDGGKSGKDKENVRALRVEILAPGTIQWETVLASDLAGEIVAVPSRLHHKQPPHGKQSSMPSKPQVGRVRVQLGGKHLVDFFPEYKQQIDAAFLPVEGDTDDTSACKVEFPTALSKYERAAIHAYCDWLGLAHASTGEGPQRRLTVTADARLTPEQLGERQQQAEASVTEVEFHADDALDVRYKPRVGDRVKLSLVLAKRSKQLLSKSIALVEAAKPNKTKDAKETKADAALVAGEGFIVAIKSDGGFGFIMPADQGVTGAENLFFHVKEVAGDVELKEGMEVQYRVAHDDKKKKSRAVGITVAPAGTVKKVEASLVRGVVHRPSLLQRFRRFGKHDKNKPTSSIGRIRVAAESGAADAEVEDDDEEDDEDEGDELQDDAKAEEVEETKADADAGDKKKKKKTATASSSYVYYVNDVTDPAVVLREGDDVEFVPHKTPKGLRAMRIRLVQSHAKQGVVTSVTSDQGGVIRVDGDDALDVAFTARSVLRGDVLSVGDRVEFAVVKRPVEKKPKMKTADDATAETPDAPSEPTTATPWIASSVLCLVSSGAAAKPTRESARPESRTVNSTLLQAMRQVGASAVAKSRMAKGPDGTRGFPAGWRTTTTTPPTEEA